MSVPLFDRDRHCLSLSVIVIDASMSDCDQCNNVCPPPWSWLSTGVTSWYCLLKEHGCQRCREIVCQPSSCTFWLMSLCNSMYCLLKEHGCQRCREIVCQPSSCTFWLMALCDSMYCLLKEHGCQRCREIVCCLPGLQGAYFEPRNALR